MIKFRVKKRTRMTASMVASACFVALAIWGWDLPVATALQFLFICLVSLVIIVGSAALLGWLLNRLRGEKSLEDND